ncbi:MAG: gamma-glutamyltransferase family protein [Gammaproteobacteria bacterium]|nr:gamma-glutamyltransferase family protein [Gammaproteobacteria bacterium]
MLGGATGEPSRFGASRSVVCASRGIVATSQPLAAYEAVRVLEDGGNAIDAGVAAALMLCVTEPMQIGPGGDVLALVFDAASGELIGLNSSGSAPAAADLDTLRARLGAEATQLPLHSILAVTVPGAVDGWLALHDRFGRLDRSRLFAPAVRAAREGFAVAPQTAATWAMGAPILARQRHSKETWLGPDGAPFGCAERFRNLRLADSLEMIATSGRAAMYGGPLGNAVIEASNEQHGLLCEADLAQHRIEWVEPQLVGYRGYTVAEMPPNAQGIAVLEALAILERFDFAGVDFGSPEAAHWQVQATKLGLADAATHITDASRMRTSVKNLLDPQRIESLHEAIVNGHPSVAPAATGGGDTAFVCAADDEGNWVSLIGSLFHPWGSGLTAGNAGFLLQNRGHGFSLDPAHANVIEPAKKTRHTILPAMLLHGGKPVMAFGFVGGDMQVQGQVQFLSNLIDFGMDPQSALDAPRWRIEDNLRDTALEPGLLNTIGGELAVRGHRVTDSGGFFGGGQAVLHRPEFGTFQGVSDGRRDGCALGI